MNAVFVLGTLEPSAVKVGMPLTKRTERLLRHLARDLDGVEIVFAVQDEILCGKDKSKIGIARIRKDRPRVLSEIGLAKPDFVMCFGPVAAASVLGHGNLSEDKLIRTRHEPFEAGPPVYYTYSLENVRRAAGLAQWLDLDVQAAIHGFAKTKWGQYDIIRPGDDFWESMPPYEIARIGTRSGPQVMALDLETYPGLEFYHPEARIRMAQISDQVGRAWVIQATLDSRFPDWLVKLIENPDVVKTGSNIKFDVCWLWRFGIEAHNFVDTSTREHIIDESNPKKDLKSLTLKYLPRLGDYSRPHNELVRERGGWEHIRDEEMYLYAGADAEASIATYRGQETQLSDMQRPHELMRRLYAVLARIEFNGIRVDVDENRCLCKAYLDRMDQAQRKIEAVLGPVNLNSPTQLARALQANVPGIDLTLKDWRNLVGNAEDSDISTAREILERESYKDPVIQDVLEHRRYRTRHSTFIKGVYEKHLQYHHGAHFLHTHYRTDLVETFRLSSQAPNMMNMPTKDYKDPELSIKRQFVSRFPGGQILEVDLSQIEIRYAAWISSDRAMIRAIESGEDIHTMMAATLLGKDPGDVSEQERYECKTRTFLIMYGGGATKLMDQLLKSDVAPRKVSKRQAIGMIQDYFRTFHGLKEFIDETRARVRRDLAVETEFGFRRRFVEPDFWRSSDGYRVERQAFNTLVQSGAACITYCAMIWLQNELERCNFQSRMVGQVHDSVVFDVHPEELTEIQRIAKTGMEIASVEEARNYGVDFTLPLRADIAIGDSWGTVQEVTE